MDIPLARRYVFFCEKLMKYGKLTPIKFNHKDKYNNHYWLYACDCGEDVVKRKGDVKNGKIKSCGCLVKTHGMSHTRIYGIWKKMKQRCDKEYTANYNRYGGRGITYCNRWKKFENFYEDMKVGYADNLTLERIDNDKGYTPENCTWATHKEQNNNSSNNRKLTFNGKTLNVTQWAEKLNIPASTLFSRLDNLGWSVKKTLQTPHKWVNNGCQKMSEKNQTQNKIRLKGNNITN